MYKVHRNTKSYTSVRLTYTSVEVVLASEYYSLYPLMRLSLALLGSIYLFG